MWALIDIGTHIQSSQGKYSKLSTFDLIQVKPDSNID